MNRVGFEPAIRPASPGPAIVCPSAPPRASPARARLLAALLLVVPLAFPLVFPWAHAAAVPPGPAARARLLHAEAARRAALAARAAAMARAARLHEAALALAARRRAAAARLRAAQAATAAAEAERTALTRTAARARARLRAGRLALAPLLPILERLSLYPTETLLAAPVPPAQALRGVQALRGLTRALAARLRALRADQARAEAAAEAAAAVTPSLEAAEQAQAAATASLDRALAMTVADQAAAEAQARAAARRAATEAARAADLRDLLARLAQARRAEAARVRAAQAARLREAVGAVRLGAGAHPAHQLIVPVRGAVVVAYGAATPAGPASGITWRAAARAAVRAPCGGSVLFAAPFHGYGQVLILACGGGYDAVIGGFARLAATPGDLVRAGQIVGTLPGGAPRVYFELRHDGAALDPTPWLRG